MAPLQSRDTWISVSPEDPCDGPASEARRATVRVQRLAGAALVIAAMALAVLAVVDVTSFPHKGSAEVAKSLDAIGLASDEAGAAGSLTSKLSAMVSATQAGSATRKGWYIIARPAILREGRSLDSPKKGVLQLGDHVLVSEVHDRRAKVEAPQPGWVSIETANGEPILQKADPGSGSAGAQLPGLGGLQQPKLPAGKGSKGWKGLSAGELHKAIKEGKVDPNVVMANGFGKLSGFLSSANKELEGIMDKKGKHAAGSEGAGLPAKDAPPTPFRLPSFEKVQAMMESRMAQQHAGQAGQASQAQASARNQKLLRQNALQVAKKLLHNEGQRLSDATKSLPLSKEILKKTIKEKQDNIDQARATLE